MNNRILIQVAGPTVVIGLLLCATCLLSAWYVNRIQLNLTSIVSQNVASLQAAKQVEIAVRRLRFHFLLSLNDPEPKVVEQIDEDHRRFEQAIAQAKNTANTPREVRCVQKMEEGYAEYQKRLADVKGSGSDGGHRQAKVRWPADSGPLQHVLEPCEEYFVINEKSMAETADESERVGAQLRVIMLLFGLGGPLGGLLSGYGIARGLSRSIHRLSVQVQDMAHYLEQDVGSVKLIPGGDIQQLDQQIQHVVRRVAEVAERLQQHQRDMLRAEQLSAVGQLAASMAHEIRNPLTSIKMLVEAGLRSHKPRPVTGENLHVIHTEVARLERTVQSFLDFARPAALQRSSWDLRDVLGHAAELVRARARQQKVAVELHTPEAPIIVSIDRDQFCSVLVNLFINALDAMPGGGRLEVTLRVAPKSGILLTVADTGKGLAPELTGRLFTPFTSTKATGSGLGLSICKRVIEEHGGTITASSRAEGGACFTIGLAQNLCEW